MRFSLGPSPSPPNALERLTLTHSELDTLRDEVFRRVGRNLVNYQRLERILKNLLSLGPVKGPARELQNLQAKRAKAVQKFTLGMLANEFVDVILADAGAPDPLDGVAVSELHISFSVRFETDAGSRRILEETLRTLVASRNRLVHHLDQDWDIESRESTLAMASKLEADREYLQPLYAQVWRILRTFADGARSHLQLFSSAEFERVFRSGAVQQQPLAQGLIACIEKLARADGWLALANAGRMLRQQMPQEFEDFQARMGHPTLKQWMLSTGVFELREEAAGMGTRTMYRLAPEPDLGAH